MKKIIICLLVLIAWKESYYRPACVRPGEEFKMVYRSWECVETVEKEGEFESMEKAMEHFANLPTNYGMVKYHDFKIKEPEK